jgi:hypothetical protein
MISIDKEFIYVVVYVGIVNSIPETFYMYADKNSL